MRRRVPLVLALCLLIGMAARSALAGQVPGQCSTGYPCTDNTVIPPIEAKCHLDENQEFSWENIADNPAVTVHRCNDGAGTCVKFRTKCGVTKNYLFGTCHLPVISTWEWPPPAGSPGWAPFDNLGPHENNCR